MLLWIYLLAVILSMIGFAFAFSGFAAIDDLVDDFRNPVDACKILNHSYRYEFAMQAALTLIFMWHPWFFLLNLVVLFFDMWQMARRGGRLTGWSLYDSKRIAKRQNRVWTIQLVKICFYPVMAIIYSMLAFYYTFN